MRGPENLETRDVLSATAFIVATVHEGGDVFLHSTEPIEESVRVQVQIPGQFSEIKQVDDLDAHTRTGIVLPEGYDEDELRVTINIPNVTFEGGVWVPRLETIEVDQETPDDGNPFYDEFIGFEPPELGDFNGDGVADKIVSVVNNGNTLYGVRYTLLHEPIDFDVHVSPQAFYEKFLQNSDGAWFDFYVNNNGPQAIELEAQFAVELDGELHYTETRSLIVPSNGFSEDSVIAAFDGILDPYQRITQTYSVSLGEAVVVEGEESNEVMPTVLGPVDVSLQHRVVEVTADDLVFDLTVENHSEIAAIDWAVFSRQVSIEFPMSGDHTGMHLGYFPKGTHTVRLSVPVSQLQHMEDDAFTLTINNNLSRGSFAVGNGPQDDLNLSNNTIEIALPNALFELNGIVGPDGRISLFGGDYDVTGVEIVAAAGSMVVEDNEQWSVIASGDSVALASLNGPVRIGAGLVLPVLYHGLAENLTAVWGDPHGNLHTVVMTGGACGFGLSGDANNDGQVGFLDFLRLANNFNKIDAAFADGDFNCDGKVNFADFLTLAQNYGTQA